MKHASQAALDRIGLLLDEIRKRPALKEKSSGTFYRRSRAFLHFHEHGDEMFADVRLKDDFERLPATSRSDWKKLLKLVDDALSADR